jgi:hypothetical protein
MRRRSDYENDMFRPTITDRAIEQLLSGIPTDNEELNGLVPFVEMLRAQGMHTPSDAAIDLLAAEAAAIVSARRSTQVAEPESRSKPALRRLRPQIAAALATVLVITGMTGVAVAADDAAPGDALYGLDRALEVIGIGDGRVEERLEEAGALIADGHSQRALEHATVALDEAAVDGEDVTDLLEAKAAITDATSIISSSEEDNAAIVQVNVALLLQYIKENLGKDIGTDGREFGQGVAELAKNISRSDETVEPADDTVSPPEEVDEKPENPGPPEVVPANPGGNGNDNDNGNDNGNSNSNGNGNGNSNGNDNGNDNGNGPPEGSPSETAPGRGNRP